MRVAVLSESPADEASLWVLLHAICPHPMEPVGLHARQRPRGWTGVRDLLPNVLTQLYYGSDAEALVVLTDSDDEPLHRPEHDLPDGYDPDCRYCVLQAIGLRTLTQTDGRISGRTLRFAIGIAVPAVEAWWRCGIDPHSTELAWGRGLGRGPRRQLRAELKQAVYGTDHPPLPLARRRMVEEATRLASDIASLERHFPIGFGRMAAEVRSWTS